MAFWLSVEYHWLSCLRLEKSILGFRRAKTSSKSTLTCLIMKLSVSLWEREQNENMEKTNDDIIDGLTRHTDAHVLQTTISGSEEEVVVIVHDTL